MKASGAGSVMADRARGEVAGDDAQQARWRRLEYFPTPLWAARAGGELVNAIDPPDVLRAGVVGPSGPPDPSRPAGSPWTCWEPACGEGHMAAALAEYFFAVHATDIEDHGWDGQHRPPLDFLSAEADAVFGAGGGPDWIVTNPPFGLAAEFVAAGLRRARRGVAILARLSLLESATRFAMFFQGEHRLWAFAPFIERVPMTLGRWDPKASTATAYAWFVWVKRPVAERCAIGGRGRRAEVWPIPPGTRARLTRPDDARLWGADLRAAIVGPSGPPDPTRPARDDDLFAKPGRGE